METCLRRDMTLDIAITQNLGLRARFKARATQERVSVLLQSKKSPYLNIIVKRLENSDAAMLSFQPA